MDYNAEIPFQKEIPAGYNGVQVQLSCNNMGYYPLCCLYHDAYSKPILLDPTLTPETRDSCSHRQTPVGTTNWFEPVHTEISVLSHTVSHLVVVPTGVHYLMVSTQSINRQSLPISHGVTITYNRTAESPTQPYYSLHASPFSHAVFPL